MKSNIPDYATKVHYNYGPHKGMFHVWPSGYSDNGCGYKWQWDALGFQGEERSMTAAIQAAQQWITVNRIKQ